MNRNVEMRATVSNISKVLNRVKILTQRNGLIMKTHDVFYAVYNGRMKIRTYDNDTSELIFYDRHAPDVQVPNLNKCYKLSLSSKNSSAIKDILERALGVCGEVKRIRHLFCLGQSRIHIDFIEGLGSFIQLEVKLTAGQTEFQGRKIALQLMKQLGVTEVDMLTGAYIDLFIKSNV